MRLSISEPWLSLRVRAVSLTLMFIGKGSVKTSKDDETLSGAVAPKAANEKGSRSLAN